MVEGVGEYTTVKVKRRKGRNTVGKRLRTTKDKNVPPSQFCFSQIYPLSSKSTDCSKVEP